MPRLGRITNVIHPRWHLLLALWKPTDVLPEETSSSQNDGSSSFQSDKSNSSSSNVVPTSSTTSYIIPDSSKYTSESLDSAFLNDGTSHLKEETKLLSTNLPLKSESHSSIKMNIVPTSFMKLTESNSNDLEINSGIISTIDSSEITVRTHKPLKILPELDESGQNDEEPDENINSSAKTLYFSSEEDYTTKVPIRVNKVEEQALDVKVPAILENSRGTSLVPLMDQPKEVLPMEGEGKTLLALVKVAQGSEKLEDPFQVSSSIGKQKTDINNFPTQIIQKNLNFLVPSENKSDNITDEQSVKLDNSFVTNKKITKIVDKIKKPPNKAKSQKKLRYRKKNTNFLIMPFPSNKMPQIKDSRKTLSSVPRISINLPKIKNSTVPIYDEISGTLHVDTSIDDVEDMDILKKDTENNDLYITKSNDSHTNFVEPTLHNSKIALKSTQPKFVSSNESKISLNKSKNSSHIINQTALNPSTSESKSIKYSPDSKNKIDQNKLKPNLNDTNSYDEKKYNSNSKQSDVTQLNVLSNLEPFDQALTGNTEVNLNLQGETIKENSTSFFNDTLYEDSVPLTIEDHYKIVLEERGQSSLLFLIHK